MKLKVANANSHSMKVDFIRTIEERIMSGQWKVGDRLPSERELAAQMNISKTIVNLGLGELHNNGFVKVVARQGYFVANYMENGTFNTLLSLINYNGGSFDEKTFQSLMEFRINNEVVCAGLAARHRTQRNIDDLENSLAVLSAARQSPINADDDAAIHQAAEELFRFHHTIMCATANTIYPLVNNAFKSLSIKFTISLLKFFDPARSILLMRQLTNAIIAGDEPGARATMEMLLTQGIDSLRKGYFR